MSKYKNFILIFIVLFAFFIRIYCISDIPPSMNWDEVSLGYNAYSILTSGRDEWGKVLPNIFQAYGDFKLPVYIYMLLPFVQIFGLNIFSVRILSVISGLITVVFTYLLAQKIFRQYKNGTHPDVFALLSALLVAIEPWSFFLSRPALEANVGLMLFTTGLYFFYKGLECQKYYILSALFFSLTVWTYNSYRVFTPLFILLILFVYLRDVWKGNKKIIYTSLLVFIIFFIPMFYQMLSGSGRERYDKVSIIDDGAIGKIIDFRNNSNLNPLIEKIVFNRPVYFIYNFSKNITSHFTYRFLFSEGGSNYQFNVPGYGLLFKADLLLIMFGIFFLLKHRSRISIVILGWLFLAAVPSSITREAPHVLRSITFLPLPMLVSALGLFYLFSLAEKFIPNSMTVRRYLKYILVLIYLIIVSVESKNYLNEYFKSYKIKYSWSWQYGYESVASYIKTNYTKYDKIIITKKYGEPHEFILFYLKWNPGNYYNDPSLIRYKQSNWYWVDRFDNFYFVNDWEIPTEEWQPFVLESKKEEINCREIKCLLITSPGNFPKTWNKINDVTFLDGKTAFELYENR